MPTRRLKFLLRRIKNNSSCFFDNIEIPNTGIFSWQIIVLVDIEKPLAHVQILILLIDPNQQSCALV